MLNHAGRTYLPVFHDQLRTSVLGHATARKMRNLRQPGVADEDDAKRSPATDEQIHKFFDAWHVGDDSAQTDALNKIVKAWRADNAAGGVPVHAHLPLPKQFASALAKFSEDIDPGKLPLKSVVAKFDPSVQTLVMLQLGSAITDQKQSSDQGRHSGDLGHADSAAHGVAENLPWTSSRGTELRNGREDMTHMSRRPQGTASTGMRDAAHDEHALTESPRRGVETNRNDLGQYFVHRLDEWPTQSGRGGQTERLALPVFVGLFLRNRGVKALKGAAYGVAADVLVTIGLNQFKRPADRKWPSTGSLLSSAVTGAISGAADFGQDQWKEEAGLAFLGSVAEDCVDGIEPPRWVGAIGAAVGAGLYTRYGKERLKAIIGDKPIAQMTAKSISKFIKEVFGADVQLLPEQAKEFLEGFARAVVRAQEAAEYWERKIEELSRMLDPFLPVGPVEA